jgi:hypothetical protein
MLSGWPDLAGNRPVGLGSTRDHADEISEALNPDTDEDEEAV